MSANSINSTFTLRRLSVEVIGLFVGLWLASVPQLAKGATEYELKAVYLLNFAKGVSWPSSAFPDSKAPLIIGVLGSDPFGSTLTRVCSGETAGGRPLVVTRSRSVSGLSGCHLVFVSSSEASRTSSIVSSLASKPILLIADFSPFAAKGGHLNFILVRGSVRYEINASAAKGSGLKIPSKIQRSGTSVSGP